MILTYFLWSVHISTYNVRRMYSNCTCLWRTFYEVYILVRIMYVECTQIVHVVTYFLWSVHISTYNVRILYAFVDESDVLCILQGSSKCCMYVKIRYSLRWEIIRIRLVCIQVLFPARLSSWHTDWQWLPSAYTQWHVRLRAGVHAAAWDGRGVGDNRFWLRALPFRQPLRGLQQRVSSAASAFLRTSCRGTHAAGTALTARSCLQVSSRTFHQRHSLPFRVLRASFRPL